MVLDSVYVGDICGAFGMIWVDDDALCECLLVKLWILLVILGFGLIVMVGDNDVGVYNIYI